MEYLKKAIAIFSSLGIMGALFYGLYMIADALEYVSYAEHFFRDLSEWVFAIGAFGLLSCLAGLLGFWIYELIRKNQ